MMQIKLMPFSSLGKAAELSYPKQNAKCPKFEAFDSQWVCAMKSDMGIFWHAQMGTDLVSFSPNTFQFVVLIHVVLLQWHDLIQSSQSLQ